MLHTLIILLMLNNCFAYCSTVFMSDSTSTKLLLKWDGLSQTNWQGFFSLIESVFRHLPIAITKKSDAVCQKAYPPVSDEDWANLKATNIHRWAPGGPSTGVAGCWMERVAGCSEPGGGGGSRGCCWRSCGAGTSIVQAGRCPGRLGSLIRADGGPGGRQAIGRWARPSWAGARVARPTGRQIVANERDNGPLNVNTNLMM